MLLRTIVIDDEKRRRGVIQRMLHKYCSGTVEIVAMAESADAGRKQLRSVLPIWFFLMWKCRKNPVGITAIIRKN